MKQTAVEFLIEWFNKHWNGETHMTFTEAKEQAKELEKQQIIDAYEAGNANDIHPDDIRENEANIYYTQTFKDK